jgi:hypothetical protein
MGKKKIVEQVGEVKVEETQETVEEFQSIEKIDQLNQKCSNLGCGKYSEASPVGCATNWGEDVPPVNECCTEFISFDVVQAGVHKCDECSLEFATCESQSVTYASDTNPGAFDAETDYVLACGSFTPKHNLADVAAYIPSPLDRFSLKFTKFLPVPVPEHQLAEYAQEMARLHALWVRTKLDAKAFAKSAKEVTDSCEKQELEIAEIINSGEEEIQVMCHWSYDFTHHVKRLIRLDTNAVVEERALEPEDYQSDLPLFDAPEDTGGTQDDKTDEGEGGNGGEGAETSQVENADETEFMGEDENLVQIEGLSEYELRDVQFQAGEGHPMIADLNVDAFDLAPGPVIIGMDLASGPDMTATREINSLDDGWPDPPERLS